MKKVYDDTEFMNIASKVLFNEEFLKTSSTIVSNVLKMLIENIVM